MPNYILPIGSSTVAGITDEIYEYRLIVGHTPDLLEMTRRQIIYIKREIDKTCYSFIETDPKKSIYENVAFHGIPVRVIDHNPLPNGNAFPKANFELEEKP